MSDRFKLNIKAQSLRKQLGVELDSPIDIFGLVHTIKNLTIMLFPMSENISGMCIKNDGYPVIAINSTKSLGRQRFSLAHELYHLYYDMSNELSVCLKMIGQGNTVEQEADQFASLFLIPPMALQTQINQFCANNPISLEQIVRLEQYFGVSRQAILYRLVQEKIITPKKAVQFQKGVIVSAKQFGFDESLYVASVLSKQYYTYGYYVTLAKQLNDKQMISIGRYEELLLQAFRDDLVYGDDQLGGELND